MTLSKYYPVLNNLTSSHTFSKTFYYFSTQFENNQEQMLFPFRFFSKSRAICLRILAFVRSVLVRRSVIYNPFGQPCTLPTPSCLDARLVLLHRCLETIKVASRSCLRAAVRKYRLGVCKMKKSKIPKLCQNIGLGKLFLEK